MKKIILTGGGTAGHVTPNIALIPKLKEKGYEIIYIGSKEGIEKKLIEEQGIKYYSIESGKLRRYIDLKNITDSIKVVKGVAQSIKLIKKIKPNIIFSKGGFVSVPVVIGGYLNKVPVIIHESDMTSGLANKISAPFSNKICITFSEAIKNFPKEKVIITGTPIRKELLKGEKEKGLKITKFKNNNPVILIMGGSLGAEKINKTIENSLEKLLNNYNVIHICGKGKLNNIEKENYYKTEYVTEELKDLLKLSDIIISRAGSNSICEILELKKPNILIPLSKNVSRGDQILNAKYFEKEGFSKVIEDDNLTKEILIKEIEDLYKNKNEYIKNMENRKVKNSEDLIIEEIEKIIKNKKI